jgi:Rieske Fe-S protein
VPDERPGGDRNPANPIEQNPADPGPVDQGRRDLIRWAWRLPVLLALAGGGVGGFAAWRVHFGKRRPDPDPTFDPAAPLRIGAFDALEPVWSALPFDYLGGPAFALRLPEPVAGGLSVGDAHYVAFSRLCTHQACPVAWNTNPEAIAVATNHRTDRPALVCGCHLSVFDPLRAGLAVSGPARLPLPRIALEARDDGLYAVGWERS